MPRKSILATVAFLTATPALAQVEWLPAEVEQAAARAMVARLAEAGVEVPGSEEEKLRGAITGRCSKSSSGTEDSAPPSLRTR